MIVEGLLWTNGSGWQSRRRRRGIGKECRRRETFIAGPEATTDLFIGGIFPEESRDAWTFRDAPTREERHGQVEGAPKEVNRTALAHKRRAVMLHEGARLLQDAPEAVRVERVVRGVNFINIVANGIQYFAGQGVDRDLDAQRVQAVHEFPIK